MVEEVVRNGSRMEELQDELRSILGEIEYLRNQVSAVDAMISDLRSVDTTLTYIKEKGKGRAIYIPLGSGIAIKGKIEDVNDLIMDVGAGIVIGANIDEVKDEIERRINTLMNLRLTLLRRIEEDSGKVNKLLEEIRKLGEHLKGSQ